jgi:hypothetical protein
MRRIVGVGFLVAMWAALFEVPSAVATGRGAPPWLAATIGGVLVALVIGWHLWGERRKREKATLTAWDRLALRTVAIAALAGAGAWFLAKPSLAATMHQHAWWMIPRSTSGLVADGKLLDQVPASAETIVWLRSRGSAALGELLSQVPQLGEIPAERYELVGAAAADDALLEVDASRDVQDAWERMIDTVRGWTGLPVPTATDVGSAKQWSTAGWRDQLGKGHPAVFALFEQAPTDADIVVVHRVAKPRPHEPVSAVAWLRVDGEVLEISVDLDTPSPAVAVELEAEARTALERGWSRDGDRCVDRDLVTIGRAGSALHFGVRLEAAATVEMLRCLDRHP